MLKFKNRLLILACLLPTVSYANYTINPVQVEIKPGSMMSSLTVHNNDSVAHHFQLTLYKTDGKSGRTHDEETKDIVVTPAMFKVDGKKPQVVRVAIKNLEAANQHQHYILSIKELPYGKTEANTVKLITDFRVPITVGEAATQQAPSK